MSEQGELARELSRLVDQYLEERKGRSLATLAKAAGVGYTTVRRIAQGEAIPNQETTLAIIDVILNTRDKIAFLKKFFPRIGKLVEEAYSDEMIKQPEDELLKHFAAFEIHNLIFNIAATKLGTSKEQIARLLGERGLYVLNELLESELLKEHTSGQIFYANGTWALTNINDILQQVRHSVSYFDKSLVGTEGASLMHATASINREALKEINKLVREFSIRLIKLKDSPSSQGNIHFYTDLIMNLYDGASFQ